MVPAAEKGGRGGGMLMWGRVSVERVGLILRGSGWHVCGVGALVCLGTAGFVCGHSSLRRK